MPKHPRTPRVLLFYNSSCLSDRAVRRVEESWFGFLIAGGLCSKPGRSLCERIKLTFATAPGCLHSLSLGRHDCFGRLCNQFLPKTLRFSLQRQKAQEFCKAEFLESLPVSAFASGNSCFTHCLVQKLQNSARAEFWDCTPVFAFETGIFFRGFGFGLLVRQGFFDAKAGFVEGCNLWNVLHNPETYVW